MKPKALCLLSGGLDSTLAARIVLDLGVEVEAVNFVTVFCTCTPHSMRAAGCAAAASAARTLGIRVRTFNATETMIELVRDPPHGHGSYLNPCIDCRIHMFRRALGLMHEAGAHFLVTGEVLGERPMSQRREAMLLIERESGAEGLVLRPLSAKLLEPSLPEREGWVDREKLLAISGRSRKPQIRLAREFGLNDYPCPAGGCRLTDPGYAGRMKDLIDHIDHPPGDPAGDRATITSRDARLLRWGRHFRLSPRAKAIVGRNEEENGRIAALARAPSNRDTQDTQDTQDDERPVSCASCVSLLRSGRSEALADPVDLMGPTTLLTGVLGEAELDLACRIAASYTAAAAEAVGFKVRGADLPPRVTVAPLPRERLDEFRIGPLKPGWRSADRGASPQGTPKKRRK